MGCCAREPQAAMHYRVLGLGDSIDNHGGMLDGSTAGGTPYARDADRGV